MTVMEQGRIHGMTSQSTLPNSESSASGSLLDRIIGGAERLGNNITHGAGSGLSRLSSALRGGSGRIGSGLQSWGRDLQNTDLRDIPQSLMTMVREHPVRAGLIGLGLAFLGRRLFR